MKRLQLVTATVEQAGNIAIHPDDYSGTSNQRRVRSRVCVRSRACIRTIRLIAHLQ